MTVRLPALLCDVADVVVVLVLRVLRSRTKENRRQTNIRFHWRRQLWCTGYVPHNFYLTLNVISEPENSDIQRHVHS